MDQDASNQLQDFQKKMSHFEQKVEARCGAGSIEKSKKLAETLDPDELTAIAEQSITLSNKIVAAIKGDVPVDSKEVQNLMEEHYELSTKFQPMTKEAYLSSRELLHDAPEFYAVLHPKLPDFLYDAMGIYAENRWK